MTMETVWIQNLKGFIRGQFPADERWKDIFIDRLDKIDPARTKPRKAEVEKEISRVVQSVNEWDDRTSPKDFPDALLITSEELADILREFATKIIGGGDG